MAKQKRSARRRGKRQTNWLLIGGVAIVGLLGLGALMALTVQDSAPTAVATLAAYCESNPERCVAEGSAEAPVTVVEVSDYGCPHCRDFHAETFSRLKQQYIDTGVVRWVTLPFALDSSRIPTTNAALCANEQGAFAAMGDQLFAQQETAVAFTREGFMTAAATLALDMEAFASCVDDGRYSDIITSNIRAANNLRVNSTPTFFINDRKITGAQPLVIFQQQIEAALNE